MKYMPNNFKQSELLLSQRWAHYTSLRWASEAKAFLDLGVQIYTTGGQIVPPFLKTNTNSEANQSNIQLATKKKKEEKQEKQNKKNKEEQEKQKEKQEKNKKKKKYTQI